MGSNEQQRRGSLLQVARKKQGMTQGQLGDTIGVSVKTIHNLERGNHDNPSTMTAAMAALGLSEDDLRDEVAVTVAATNKAELQLLKRYPRGVFVALVVWGRLLAKMDEDEQDEKIDEVTLMLLDSDVG